MTAPKFSRRRRLRLAWGAARFALKATSRQTFRQGPAFVVRCSLRPSDAAVVYTDEDRGIVGLEIVYPDGSRGSVILTPETARTIAAEILNAADTADGTIPLLFVPNSPAGDDPFSAVPA